MAYAVAILLVSALTTVGLLALWAATSRTHWFWRTMLFLAAIAPVLLIPAYEPFVAFVIQGAVVAAGIQLAQWRTERKNGEAFFKSRFSLGTVLLAMVPGAVVAAVLVNAPELNWYAWQSVVLIGITGGLATVFGSSIAFGKSDNWKVRSLLAMLGLSAISLTVAYGDWFIRSIDGVSGWPPNSEYLSLYFYGTYGEDDLILIWVGILLATMILTALSCALVSSPLRIISKRLLRFRQTLFALLTFAVAAPAIATFIVLMNPAQIPVTNAPNPNGYDDFVAAGQRMTDQLIVNSGNYDADTATESELQKANDEVSVALDRVRVGLKKDVEAKTEYINGSLPLEYIQEFRSLARGFDAQARLAVKQQQHKKAVDIYLDVVTFGAMFSRGGLMIDDLVGIACSNVGCRGLYEMLDSIPVKQIPSLIADLQQIESLRESSEAFIARDQIWSQNANGWYGHLLFRLAKWTDLEMNSEDTYQAARQRDLAILRLLQVELALRLYRNETRHWPETISDLVPKYLASIPVDPMSHTKKTIQYIKQDQGYILYSVGFNVIDEQGSPGSDDGFGDYDPWTGDLRLDILFKPVSPLPSAAVPAPLDGDEEASEP